MEPIINPLWFYLIDIVDGVKSTCTFMLIVSFTVLAIISFVFLFSWSEDNLEEKEKQSYFRYLKLMLKVVIPCVIITIFTPCSDTIYKMIIADNVTPHNIEVVGDTIEGGIDYIFEKINSLTLEEEVKE